MSIHAHAHLFCLNILGPPVAERSVLSCVDTNVFQACRAQLGVFRSLGLSGLNDRFVGIGNDVLERKVKVFRNDLGHIVFGQSRGRGSVMQDRRKLFTDVCLISLLRREVSENSRERSYKTRPMSATLVGNRTW